ncbi:phosphatase PAP2 family protein [Luteipulveratus sp. YIM 133132]|uniref:phosphatase PAP2 family protein n=1 Tax=Luteipulveratus flavus TaxID=3031728 RepID=UPI0023B07F4B|nr:phosphatase PAP2 family protein [Luteipulveratus sp. YIM 133132]MDE9364892.1 phosphatase PAP2 family protein [Luteipulveratus sp. YIM 133132]
MAIASERLQAPVEQPSVPSDIAFGRVSWTLLRRAALVVFAATLAVSVRLDGIPLDRVRMTLWILVGLSLTVIGKGWRAWLRVMWDWLPFQGVLLAYDYSYGIAGRYDSVGLPREGDTNVIGVPLHVTFPVDADRFLFGGTLPNQWVQEHFVPASGIPWYAAVVTLVYCSHFIVPLVTAAVLWVRDRDLFRAWRGLVLGLAVAGLLTYFLFPMSPPWLASQQAEIAGAPVDRITGRGWSLLGLHSAGQLLNDGQARSNPVGAMPSLHMAYAVLAAVFFMILTRRRWVRRLLPIYPAAMAFSLVYSGEHYVIDEIAGLVYALVVIGIWRLWVRRRREVGSSGREVPDGEALLGTADRPEDVVEGGRRQADPALPERH